jgi:hypothetical protein
MELVAVGIERQGQAADLAYQQISPYVIASIQQYQSRLIIAMNKKK